MRKTTLLLSSLLFTVLLFAQKKPLDHTVYDGWQSIGEKLISNNGQWIVYTIDPQEGDNQLVIQSPDGGYKKTFDRGYNAVITEDSRYLIFRIRPPFKETREARIKKKKTDEFPKDSLAIIELGKDSVWRKANVRNYKTPDKSAGWLAYHLEKTITPGAKPNMATAGGKKTADSLARIIDSLHKVIEQYANRKSGNQDEFNQDADGDDAQPASGDAGTDLILRKLSNGQEVRFKRIVEYLFSENGSKLLVEQARDSKDSLSNTLILLYDLHKGFADTLSRAGNDFKNFELSEDGSQVAWLAERDAKPKDLQRFYKLWYYEEGMDSATAIVDKNTVGMNLGMTVSEWGSVKFSKSGKRLFFGTGLIQPPKDTTLVESDLAKLDVWHYKDDYLQTIQLFRLVQDLHQNYLAVYHMDNKQIRQIGSRELPTVVQTNEGDGEYFIAVTDTGRRVESQWMGNTRKDIYAINVNDGSRKLIKRNLEGVINPTYISPSGKYVAWYDSKTKNYFAWDGDSTRNITARIKTPLSNELHDSPSDPSPYGLMGWQEGDSAIFIYDRYDIWKVDPTAKRRPSLIFPWTAKHRSQKLNMRYVRTDPQERFISGGQDLLFRISDEAKKTSTLYSTNLNDNSSSVSLFLQGASFGNVRKAEDTEGYIFTRENYTNPPDLFYSKLGETASNEIKLSSINPQQAEYNWGTAELYHWTTFKGKKSTGILYKPENFNPRKKYPVIFYFYERLSDGLYSYIPPSPTPSRLNISFFVSRGYLVFAPDIAYTIGHPAASAYDFIVSAAKDLAKKPWVDAGKMGLQGQSWGGIQVAQVITMTDMFKAAWAGAPVANMTSAYGGIRWESGSNRQFQYEKTQSRIGATLWEKPQLYIENSPLFHLPKVKTPLVIMANDADGAVPWYQGIELFTGLRRLGKPAWMLNYNGEAHNLVQRRNRKDIQVREQQYFDWLLKDEKPARWITDGVPAVDKGRDWGLD